MTIYRIAKWDEVFERAESRKLKVLTWIAMPVGFHSNGYQSLLDEFEADAAAAYGAWCALASVAATCTVRGLLANGHGTAMKLSHIARRTGLPEALFVRLITWAVDPSVRWLEEVSEAEAKALLLEKISEISKEKSYSGESPDDPPARWENSPTTQPNQTQPNPTEHNPTSPNPTRPIKPVGGGGCRDLVSLDLKEVGRQCLKLDRALSKVGIVGIKGDDIWRWGVMAERVSPSLLSEVATKVISREISKPNAYIEKALRNRCSEAGVMFADIASEIPSREQEPATV